MNAKESIIAKMEDTEDPVIGAVFEKKVKTDFVEFNEFMFHIFPDVKQYRQRDGAEYITSFFCKGKHAGSLVNDKQGYFGGTRIGSKNPYHNPGEPFVKEPFIY